MHYLFLRREAQPWQGHNPLAMAAMFFMYVLGTVFMICTGFALYGEGLGMHSWAYTAVLVVGAAAAGLQPERAHAAPPGHVVPDLSSRMVHLYMVVREDIMSGETVISTMVNGWRVSKQVSSAAASDEPRRAPPAAGAGAGHRQPAVGRRRLRRARGRGAAPALPAAARRVAGRWRHAGHVPARPRLRRRPRAGARRHRLQARAGHAARVPRRRGAGMGRHR